jgi:hypothetical protein
MHPSNDHLSETSSGAKLVTLSVEASISETIRNFSTPASSCLQHGKKHIRLTIHQRKYDGPKHAFLHNNVCNDEDS